MEDAAVARFLGATQVPMREQGCWSEERREWRGIGRSGQAACRVEAAGGGFLQSFKGVFETRLDFRI